MTPSETEGQMAFAGVGYPMLNDSKDVLAELDDLQIEDPDERRAASFKAAQAIADRITGRTAGDMTTTTRRSWPGPRHDAPDGAEVWLRSRLQANRERIHEERGLGPVPADLSCPLPVMLPPDLIEHNIGLYYEHRRSLRVAKAEAEGRTVRAYVKLSDMTDEERNARRRAQKAASKARNKAVG